MRFLPILLGWMGVKGCQCQPTLPPDPPDSPPDPTGTTGVTGDTGPAPPCAWPEIEPNNTFNEPTYLGMEQWGCGGIAGGQPPDADVWTFTLEHDSWLEVEAGQGNGSIANMGFLLFPRGDSWSASRIADPRNPDATIRFQAPAGDYILQVFERTNQGGDRYYYDVLASEAKAPFDWTGIRNETEPNGSQFGTVPANANAENIDEHLADGFDQIYGTLIYDGQPDRDWYVLTIPPGRHTLSIDIDAYDYGSGGDLTVIRYDQNLEMLPQGCNASATCVGNNCCELRGGVIGEELDPIGDYDSLGAELVYIQVLEKDDRPSPANWYVLKVSLVGDEP